MSIHVWNASPYTCVTYLTHWSSRRHAGGVGARGGEGREAWVRARRYAQCSYIPPRAGKFAALFGALSRAICGTQHFSRSNVGNCPPRAKTIAGDSAADVLPANVVVTCDGGGGRARGGGGGQLYEEMYGCVCVCGAICGVEFSALLCVCSADEVCVCVWRDSFTCVAWLVHMCDMTHSYVWRDSLIHVTLLVHLCDVTCLYVWHDSILVLCRRDEWVCVTLLIHMCDMTRSYVWCAVFICANWLIQCALLTSCVRVCNVTRSHVWHDSFIRLVHVWYDSVILVAWLVHMCDINNSIDKANAHDPHMRDMTRLYVWRNFSICVPWLNHMSDTHRAIGLANTHNHMCDMTRSTVCHDLFICVPWLAVSLYVHCVVCALRVQWVVNVCDIN